MTTPVIQVIHKKYPDASIDFVADRRSSVLYENCPYKNKIYIKDKNKFMRGLPGLLADLWQQKY
ncbi:MAG: glycosyltransferase family 9 protein, partial [Pseudomonadota bacterium]